MIENKNYDKSDYWITNPLKVNNINNINYIPVQILSNKELLKKVTNDINNHKYNLYYKVNDPTITPKIICDFINNNYFEITNSEFKFIYTIDLIKYYINNSLIICFYKNENEYYKSKIIGLIVGKKEKLFVYDKEINSVEVNFLSLDKKFRSKNIAPLMISILTKETIELFSIGLAHYTITKDIMSPYYGIKNIYHRIININKLFESKFISDIQNLENINSYKNFYNKFNHNLYHLKIIYLNSKKNNNYSQIFLKLIYNFSSDKSVNVFYSPIKDISSQEENLLNIHAEDLRTNSF